MGKMCGPRRRSRQCVEWARKYIKYCVCDVKDGVSLGLGLASVLSWGVAEVPQIITNYRHKTTEGLSIAFLFTWIFGDLLNLFGCMLEPATLPTQYYMAMLFTMTTLILTAQTIYYKHIYHRLKSSRRFQKVVEPFHNEAVDKKGHDEKQGSDSDTWGNGNNIFASGVAPSSPIPLPTHPHQSSPERESYYMSARSLARSHTPTAGSILAQRRTTTSFYDRNSVEELLLGGVVPTLSSPSTTTKPMLCAVSVLTFFFGLFNLHKRERNRIDHIISGKPNNGVVVLLGRKLLQVSGGLLQETGEGSSAIGTFLGWGMAAIYVGGRLPQIYLNIRRGHAEGLNPLMFIFALVGNATYVASILVSSLDWSKIRPNLPWLVDAGGCVVLDTLILLQFLCFHYKTSGGAKTKHGNTSDA